MHKAYTKPELVFYGNIEDITRADQNDSDSDGNFVNGVLVGPGTGSADSCYQTDEDGNIFPC